jgi:hypothetical protein
LNTSLIFYIKIVFLTVQYRINLLRHDHNMKFNYFAISRSILSSVAFLHVFLCHLYLGCTLPTNPATQYPNGRVHLMMWATSREIPFTLDLDKAVRSWMQNGWLA